MRTYLPEDAGYTYDTPRHSGKAGVLLMRTKTVIAGDHLDADIYPVLEWPYKREAERRGKTPEQMRRANYARALRYFTQLANKNFGEGDLFATLKMAGECTFEEFKRHKRRFMDRVRARFKAAGIKCEYIGVIESIRGGTKHHIHMILRGGVIGRDELEKLWTLGTTNTRRVQVEWQEHGVEGLCRYMTQHKDTQEKLMNHKWFASKGLKKPRPTYNDRKFSRAAANRIARAVQEDAKNAFEKRYPGWTLTDYSVHYSDFLPGVYIHAHMRRRQ